MKNIRKGNDIRFRWQIRRGEDAESFDGKELKVLLRDQFGNSCDVEWSVAGGGIISGVSRGKTQSKLGVYTLTLVENDGANNMATVDKISAWRLVAVQDASLVDDEKSAFTDGGIDVEVVELSSEIGLGGTDVAVDTELNPDSDNAIANSAVTKGINAVGEMTEEDIQEVVNNSPAYYQQKAKKKKVQQIIIGKAIKPGSVSCTKTENWYAFIHDLCIYIDPDKYKGYKIKCVTTIYGKTYDLNVKDKIYYVHCFYGYSDYVKYCVREFDVDHDRKSIYIQLECRDASKTLKGVSLTKEWVNGKMVRKNTTDWGLIFQSLLDYPINYYCYMDIQRLVRANKNVKMRNHRDENGDQNFTTSVKRYKRWFFDKNGNRYGNRRGKVKPGLYRCRTLNNCHKTEWRKMYVRIIGGKTVRVEYI